MSNITTLTIDNGNLILKKADAGLESFKLFFEIVLKAEELLVTSAQQSQPKDGVTTITGQTNAWSNEPATVILLYQVDSSRLQQLTLVKPISEFVGLDLENGVFSDLQLHLHALMPDDGSSGLALVSREIKGKLHLGQKLTIDFKIQHPVASSAMLVEVESELGLNEAAHLFGNADDPEKDLAWLPANLRDSNLLSLRDLQFRISPDEGLSFVSVTLLVDEGHRWPIIPGVSWLAVGGLSMTLDVDYPLQPDYRFPVFSVTGMIQLGEPNTNEGLIAITARWPDFAIRGGLVEGSEIKIGELLRQAGYSTEGLPSGDDTLTISRLSFSAEPESDPKLFNFFIDIDNVWTFQLPGKEALAITELSLLLNYSSAAGVGIGGQFTGKFNIAGIDLFMQATHPSAAAGWQFKGGSGPGQQIPIGALIADLEKKMGVTSVPANLEGLVIENLLVAIDTKTKSFFFTIETKFPINGKEVNVVLAIDLKRGPNNYSSFVSGKITIDPLEFDLIFNQDQTATLFLASYQNLAGGVIPIGPLVDHISSDQDLIKLANSLEIELKDALFAYDKPQLPANGDPANPDPAPETEQAKFLFALDIGGGINLSNLPLVGQSFPKDQSLRVMFQPIITSQLFEQPQVSAIKALIPSGGTPLPDKQLGQGVILSATLRMGQTSFDLDFSLQPNQVGQTTPPVGTPVTPVGAPPAVPADDVRWVNLQKSFGPVHFNRVGLKIQDQVLWFFLDASLAAGGLTISLDGLGAGSSLKALVPQFQLRGLGIDYKNGPLEIGGAFLRFIIDNVEEYDGLAVIKTEKLSLAAIGSYTRIEDHPSMFLYAVLDYPLGGPAFFFITGLAAGFGYNRRLLMPPIEQVGTFPLVAEAVGGVGQSPVPATGNAAQRQALVAELTKLRQYVPPSVGQIFLAIGIKFTTFEMVESFALLAVQFGNRFELDVLGLSTLVVPTPEVGQTVSPLAEVQMALKATFIPAEGFLGIQAQLTPNSFILSRACRLTGGFAFFSWFGGEHEGDFVITLGGYHPDFKVPAHYPKVPRVGFNWQVTSQLTLKGGMYYALTASALMAGGELQAVWESSKVKAWFIIGADFLIAWKPYHYQARVYVSIGVSVYLLGRGVKPITVEVGADLQIWGPDFAGIAEVHLWIISFTIQFGSNTPPKQEPIDWPTFRSSFLPSDDAVCSVAVTGGLVRKASDDTNDLGIINPRQLALVTNSVIPVKTANRRAVGNGIDLGEATTNFGIGSMAVDSASLQTVQTITITHEGQPAEADFAFRPVTKNAPAGLWGHSLKPDLNGDKLISNTVSGFEIVPANPPTPGHTENIDRRNLQFDTTLLANAYEWGGVTDWFVRPGLPKDEIKWTITNQGSTFSRNQILEDLGFVGARDVDITPEAVDAFVKDPIIVAL